MTELSHYAILRIGSQRKRNLYRKEPNSMPISTATATATTNRSTSNASNASNAFNAPDLPRQESLLFYGDKLTALMDSDGEIFVVMNEILRAIGFDDNKVYNQRKAWGQDAWIQEGTKTLPVLMKNGGMQNTTCLNRRYLPLAIASISLTPTMQREHPEIVDKLKRYQTKCSDVLYEYFFRKQQEKSGKQLGADIPLTREEMAAYFTCLMDTFKGYTAMLDRRDSERETLLTKLVDSQSTFNSTFARYIDRWRSIDAQKAIEILPGKTTTYYTNPYLINTADLAAVETWHNATMSYAAEIGRRSNQTVGLVLTSIFDTIKQKYSVDIAALAHEYWQNTGNANHSYPMLCANSDYLRAKVDEELVELARRYMPEKFTASAVFGGATAT